jgi:hypothetical protein
MCEVNWKKFLTALTLNEDFEMIKFCLDDINDFDKKNLILLTN